MKFISIQYVRLFFFLLYFVFTLNSLASAKSATTFERSNTDIGPWLQTQSPCREKMSFQVILAFIIMIF